MRTMKKTKQAKVIVLALSTITALPAVADITPVLDGYAYELYDDVIIDTENNIITIDSNLQNCQQPNGDPPLDTTLYALYSNSEFIGLSQFVYKTSTDTLFFTSETSNLVCSNGVYVDTIYGGGFE